MRVTPAMTPSTNTSSKERESKENRQTTKRTSNTTHNTITTREDRMSWRMRDKDTTMEQSRWRRLKL